MASDDIRSQKNLEPTIRSLQANKVQMFLVSHRKTPGNVSVFASAQQKEIRNMRKYLWIAIAALLVGVTAPNVNADTTYNVVTGFSYTSNPNGVWTYEYDGTAFTDAQGHSNVTVGLPGWWNGGTQPNSRAIVQNVTGSAVVNSTVTDPNNTLYLDPQGGSVSVLFTAPAASTYTITGNFLGIDMVGNSHPVTILDDGTVVWSGTIATYGQDDSFNFMETLKAGDTISFDVGTGTGGTCTYCFLGTGLNGTVTEKSSTTSTPEPATLALTLVGIGFVLVLRKRSSHGSHQTA